MDTNVLLALAWPNHQHHAAAHEWFLREGNHGWATCALTQLGFIRLSSNPAYTAAAVAPTAAASVLEQLVAHKNHRFWPSPPALPPLLFQRAIGHQQVNDAYLVHVARRQKGRLVTLDARIAAHDHPEGSVLVIPSEI